MDNLIGVDFESTWQKGIRAAGTHGPLAYAMHPDTEIYLCSICMPDNELIIGPPDQMPWDDIGGMEWVSHNRTFDLACYKRVAADFDLNGGPKRWHCSADMTAWLGVKRSLDAAVKYLLPDEVLPDKDPRSKTNNKTAAQIKAKMWDEIVEYAGEDAYYTRELWVQWSHEFPEEERWLSEQLTMTCHRGVAIDIDFAEPHIERLETKLQGYISRIPWIGTLNKQGKPNGPDARNALIDHCAEVGIIAPTSTAKDSEAFNDWVALVGEEADFAKAISSYRSCKRVLDLLKTAVKRTSVRGMQENVMPFSMKYRGTNTGRYSGDGGFNMQNPSRDEVHGVKIRNIFIPRSKDVVFVACDLSQIEARMLLFEAKDEVQLELIRNGMDVYESHGRTSMGYKLDIPMKEGDPEGRRHAKVRVLGLGYGAGGKTFYIVALRDHKIDFAVGYDEFCELQKSRGQEVVISRKQFGIRKAGVVVRDFRKKNPLITRYWKRRMNAIIRGAHDNDGDHFEELPSGRYLYYRDVHKDKGWMATSQLGMGRRFIHGGLVTENRVSAMSQDLITRATKILEDTDGIKVCWNMHDELICEVPRKHAEDFQEYIEDVMTEVPDWAPGLPIACESHILERYDK